jgi:hypothetical protein
MINKTEDTWPEFVEWQKTATKVASYYKMCEADQRHGVREDWADDLVNAWSDTLCALDGEMYAKPITSWRDVAVLGVLALRCQASGTFDGKVEDLDSQHAMSRSIAHLVRAVGIMAQRENISSLITDADFDSVMPKGEEAEEKAA